MDRHIDQDDLLNDLPPLPPTGQEEPLGVEGGGDEEILDFDDDREPGLDVGAGFDDLDDDDDELSGDEDVRWTEGSEAAGDALDPGEVVDVDASESEDGWSGGSEASADLDPSELTAGIDDLGDESLLGGDTGEEGVEDAGSGIWRGAGTEDSEDAVPPGLPPLEDEDDSSESDADFGDDIDPLPDAVPDHR